MRKLYLLALIVFLGSTSSILAQTTTPTPTSTGAADLSGIKPNLAMGEVASVSASDNKISLQTKDGTIDVVLSSATAFKKVSAENPKLSAATDAALTDIGVGDKVLVTGNVAADKKTVPAKTVYLMTKADITKKNAAEREAWKTRGITGRIVSLNPNKEEFTIAVRGMAGEQNVIVAPKNNINYRRYAHDSVKFDDAKASTFSELKIGDQVRALGDRSTDNTTFNAERVVSGAFKMVGGTITAIDTAKNEITIKDIQTNKPVTIAVNSNSVMRKFPAEMANMMAMRMMGGGAGGAQSQQGAGQGNGNVVMMRPPQGTQPPTGGQTVVQGAPNGAVPQGGGMRGGRADLDDLLDRLPVISISDLKVGDAIGVSSSAGGNADHYTAIKLVSGVEPFFRAPQMTMGAGGGRSNQPQINIPGLDGGFGTP